MNYKSIVLASMVTLVTSVSMAQSAADIAKVNTSIQEILAEVNAIPGSKVEMNVSKLQVDDKAARAYAADLNVSVVTDQSSASAQLKVDYENQEAATDAKMMVAGVLNVDLKKIFRESFDAFMQDFDKAIVDLIQSVKGEDVKVDVQSERQFDAAGKLSQVNAKLNIKLDLSKKTQDEIAAEMLKEVGIEVGMGAKGLSFKVDLTFNKQYQAFQQDQVGMKEMINGLLSGDESTYMALKQMAGMVYAVVAGAISAEDGSALR